MDPNILGWIKNVMDNLQLDKYSGYYKTTAITLKP